MLTLLWYELGDTEGKVRSFQTKNGSRPFHFSNCRREFPFGLQENAWRNAYQALGPAGRTIVDRVQGTSGDHVRNLIIDRSILVVRVKHIESWDDIMRRITEVVRDLSGEEIVVETDTPTPQVSKT